jgi:4,5-DOPA dioxygenase extradiol
MRMPTGFVAHGSPMLGLDQAMGAPLRAWSAALPEPRAYLVISAHDERAPLTLGATTVVPLVYDFGGFPPELSRVTYPAPGAPELAERVAALVGGAGRELRRSQRGLDHGVWTPLVHLRPGADLPVLELSMPRTDRAPALLALGQALAPLRDEGVFILGSGNLVHNLGRVDWSGTGQPPPWAQEFDAWIDEVITRRDWDALVDYEAKAPALRLAHPTHEHFRPLLPIVGAAAADLARTVFTGWELGSISRRTVQLG